MPKKKISESATKRAAKKKTATKAAKVAPATVTKKIAKKAAAKVVKQAAKKGAPSPAAMVAPPKPDLIAETAYRFYLERLEKGLPGDEEGDWLAAEQAVQAVQAA